MLINCPECGREISDKSEKCIHCGFPLQESDVQICVIDGVERDLTEIFSHMKNNENYDPFRYFMDHFNMDMVPALTLRNYIRATNAIPKEYDSSREQEYDDEVGKIQRENPKYLPRCPVCQSTNIRKISGISKAGSAALFGLFAVGKVSKQWHCNNCKSEF